MNATLLIARRDLGAYLRTMSGYIIAAALLFVDGMLFNIFAVGADDKMSANVLREFFYYSSGLVVIASLLLSMRLIAEDRQSGTLVVLTSSPVTDRQIVVGKYLSSLAFLGLFILSTIFMPLLLMKAGKISFGHIAAGYLGLFLMGGAALAIGIFGSALGRNQILAIIYSACITTALILAWMLARITERPLSDVFNALALHGQHFPPFGQGTIQLRDVAYYLGVIYVFLFGAVRVMEARRWR